MRQFIFAIISLFIIQHSHANSLDASEYPNAYWMNDGYVESGSPTNAISQIVDEFNTHGDWSPSTNVNIVIPVNGESTQFFRMDFE